MAADPWKKKKKTEASQCIVVQPCFGTPLPMTKNARRGEERQAQPGPLTKQVADVGEHGVAKEKETKLGDVARNQSPCVRLVPARE